MPRYLLRPASAAAHGELAAGHMASWFTKNSVITNEGTAIHVYLLDGTLFKVKVNRQTTAGAICVAIRDQVSLDASFLRIRQRATAALAVASTFSAPPRRLLGTYTRLSEPYGAFLLKNPTISASSCVRLCLVAAKPHGRQRVRPLSVCRAPGRRWRSVFPHQGQRNDHQCCQGLGFFGY